MKIDGELRVTLKLTLIMLKSSTKKELTERKKEADTNPVHTVIGNHQRKEETVKANLKKKGGENKMGIIEALCTAAHLCDPEPAKVTVSDKHGNEYEVDKDDLKKK
jgi:hypothetical protein